jgi:hypothetical protein
MKKFVVLAKFPLLGDMFSHTVICKSALTYEEAVRTQNILMKSGIILSHPLIMEVNQDSEITEAK